MADFAVWVMACETAYSPAGRFARAYEANRRTAIERIIETDPVAACVRDLMAECSSWTGTAGDLLRVRGACTDGTARLGAGWPKTPRALAGKLRRAQTFLRELGIEITFSREGQAGTRLIRMHKCPDNSVGTVSSVSGNELHPGAEQPDGLARVLHRSAHGTDDADERA